MEYMNHTYSTKNKPTAMKLLQLVDELEMKKRNLL